MSFYLTLVAHGLRPRASIAADGKWHRCPTESHPRKRNGSYKLSADCRVGWFQDFAIDHAPHTWRTDRAEDEPQYDPSWLRRAQLEARAERAERTRAARQFYDSCSPLVGGHAYLQSHNLGMTGAHGLRIDDRGWLVVPALREGKLTTVQRISPTGDKLFWKGAPVQGASYTIERARPSLTVLCEGLATGLAIFSAVPESRVTVAFNAGNLSGVQVPTGLAVIAADNDWETAQRIGKNPGIEAATAAAELFGCGIAIPEGIEGTDWADWRTEICLARLEQRRPQEREADIRRAVDAQLAMQIKRAARFVAPRTRERTMV